MDALGQTIARVIRDVPDFPKPGILFKDITPLLADHTAFRAAVGGLCERARAHNAEGLVAIESRGFLFGAAAAYELGLPLQLVRKPGKLPYETVSMSYQLEYGSDRVEMRRGKVAACLFVIELGFLRGRERLGARPVEALVTYP